MPDERKLSAATTIDVDAYKPAQIAEKIEQAGLAKTQLGTSSLLVLGILAGLFIALGAMFFTVVMTDHGLGFGPSRLLGGLAFSLGLILVVIAGAELFTGNNLLIMAWIDGRISVRDLVRNWSLVYVGNLVGCFVAASLLAASGTLAMQDGLVLQTADGIAQAKANLPVGQAFSRAILCNVLVCLAVWLSFAARDVAGKILAIFPPVTAFVALGFEHSIANMYFFAISLIAGSDVPALSAIAANLVIVTVGNVVGGAGGVGLSYWACYKMQP